MKNSASFLYIIQSPRDLSIKKISDVTNLFSNRQQEVEAVNSDLQMKQEKTYFSQVLKVLY